VRRAAVRRARTLAAVLGFAITGHAIALIVAALLVCWLGPAALTWLFTRPRVSVRDALTAPATLTLGAIVLVVIVCIAASTT
jgi:hypothetical protein